MKSKSQKQIQRQTFHKSNDGFLKEPQLSDRSHLNISKKHMHQRSQELQRNDVNFYIDDLKGQNQNLLQKVNQLEQDNFSLRFKKNEADTQKRKIKELKAQIDVLTKRSQKNYNVSIRSSIQSDNLRGSQNIQQMQFEQCLAILKIKSFDSNQDQRIFKCFQTLLNFFNEKENHTQPQNGIKKQIYNQRDFIILQQQKISQNENKSKIEQQQFKIVNDEMEQFYNSLNDNKTFNETKYLKKLFFKFAQNFPNFTKNQFNKKISEIQSFIAKLDNTSFELKKLFSKVMKKTPNKTMSNQEMIKLIQKKMFYQRRESIISTERQTEKQKNTNNEDQDIIQKQKLQIMALEQVNISLRQDLVNMKTEIEKYNKQLDDEQKILQVLKTELQQECQKSQRFQDQAINLQEQLTKLQIKENQLQNQNQFFKKKFSIISSVRNEFPQSRLSIISHDFFDDEIIDQQPDQKPAKIRTSILLGDISQEMFKEAKKTSYVSNFKEFLMNQVQKERRSISAHLSKSDNQLDSIKENSSEVLTDSEFDNKKEQEIEKKKAKKELIQNMKNQITQMQSSQQQILLSLEKKIEEKQEQDKQIDELLQQIEEQICEMNKMNEYIKELKRENKKQKENNINFQKMQEELLKDNQKLTHFNNILRKQNLEMIKLRVWKKKMTEKMNKQTPFDRKRNKTFKNWGTQTQSNKILDISVDFEILKNYSLHETFENTQTLKRDDSVKLFQNYSLFKKKVVEYKKIINKLSKTQHNFKNFK